LSFGGNPSNSCRDQMDSLSTLPQLLDDGIHAVAFAFDGGKISDQHSHDQAEIQPGLLSYNYPGVAVFGSGVSFP